MCPVYCIFSIIVREMSGFGVFMKLYEPWKGLFFLWLVCRALYLGIILVKTPVSYSREVQHPSTKMTSLT